MRTIKALYSAIIGIAVCALVVLTSHDAGATCSGWEEAQASTIDTYAYANNTCSGGSESATIYWNTHWELDPNFTQYDAYMNITSFTESGGDQWYLDLYEDCNGTWYESGVQGPYSYSTGNWELLCSLGSPTTATAAWVLI
jgi:hypothetical protein